jgi:membrane fusion protein (multidrug efflux system)
MGYSGPIDTLGDIRPVDPEAEAAERRARWRRRLLFGFFVVLLVVGSAMGVRMFDQYQRYVSTDDAYVDAQLAEVAPLIDGTIASVAVHDTQSVRRGDLLLRLDTADAQLAVDQARANYEQAVRRIEQADANTHAAEASLTARQSDLTRAELDFRRRDSLARTGAVSGDEISSARNALDNAKSAVAYAEQALAAQRAVAAGGDVEQHPEVRAAKAMLERAELDLKRTEIRSPLEGIVAQNHAQIGQRVRNGTVLMSVVPVHEAHVNANFKEVQLDRIHPGQKAILTSDLYGGTVVYHGTVVGVSGGTGAAFAVIPAQNATGNWIKVVQRLPVRIALDPRELARKPLRVGLSMTVTVDLEADAKPAQVKAAPAASKPAPKKKPAAVAVQKPVPKDMLGGFVIDPVAQPTPPKPAAKEAAAPVKDAPPPVLRTAVSY